MDTLALIRIEHRQQMQDLRVVNRRTAQAGLMLTEAQMHALVTRREDALRAQGRVSIGGRLIPELVWAFYDSPNLDHGRYAEILGELVELFYALKQESGSLFPDDRWLAEMRYYFDICHGDVELLRDRLVQNLHGWDVDTALVNTMEDSI